ncbi:DEAD/DEAH box helicase [Mesorhizobium sp. M2D.F.Ca.ET.185.01.1.1]|nr:DEAD/DEAH box helicase [Mesorhizobium sp. M2D.F.Ca.ET.232.01.1.1]TGP55929.1 DEAD/DEAH box helicase [Mesorhizobium sp. M2D.F.Ca.ET.226.01.1.1]TGP68557.1 DEAD/DEAH box helicase [Mesorhizobium sp. M2D.F.Ca.ET.225.01.1.1]TGQ31006.1 DEAD/DEAH box helicase [Mesorhizobium sp. M00.F.Ca.ET.220.01.1.1]TGQ87640.1 DEAD/DEAH box helicase [Mesorhizobium sp. M2D.F.Ca.ET.206.01.1.1]TGS27601.1 DEAD/DEAH box helicase [Mesorhizobium sp. M2D.F.Ca.ET.185.01.1.1]TGU13126.1 DEAD/DEAH box helicase [bacterium M00.
MLKRVVFDASQDAIQEDASSLTLPWWSFAGARDQFLQVLRAHELRPNEGLWVSEAATQLLQASRRAVELYRTAPDADPVEPTALLKSLDAGGFVRVLSKYQLRNVSRIAALPAAATFSVPGAGKTTEALAYFVHRAEPGDRLMVVAPKNAFAAWDEQINECLPGLKASFVRLRGGRDRIRAALSEDPRFSLLTYQQLMRLPDIVAQHIAQHRTFVFLDESHRIKAGVGAASARATIGLSHLPVGKLILSGTPMPQAVGDLLPQFLFLYPEVPAREDTVVDLMRPIYVRTNKAELNLPPVTRTFVQLPLAPVQAELYQLMRLEVAREASALLDSQGRQAFRSMGRSVARLLQFVSNPSLLASQIGFAHSDLLAAVLAEGEGPKLEYVMRRARRLSREGHKVLIWSSFVRNVEYMSSRLADLGAVFIHGGVDAGSEEDNDTREGKIKAFHDDDNVRVMVANPAAASEGVSLHRICHHAIYLDRTFNAAHYLQSEDRIHRFGLPPDQKTVIEIVECQHTVDETVRSRLGFKIGQMAAALEDSSLAPDPIPIDPTDADAEDPEEYVTGLQLEDVKALARDLGESQT